MEERFRGRAEQVAPFHPWANLFSLQVLCADTWAIPEKRPSSSPACSLQRVASGGFPMFRVRCQQQQQQFLDLQNPIGQPALDFTLLQVKGMIDLWWQIGKSFANTAG